MVLTGGCLANNSQLTFRDDEWQIQGDPTEAAFLVAAHKLEGTVDRASVTAPAGPINIAQAGPRRARTH